MRPIYLGLGSNREDRIAHLAFARRELAALAGVRLTASSRIYETRPLGPQDQGLFLNQVVRIETDRSLPQMLELCQTIEQAAGRAPRSERQVWGPRELDIDLLLAGVSGEECWATAELRVPHPGWHLRRFVLRPLADLAPDLRPGGQEASVAELLACLPGEGPGAELDPIDAADAGPQAL